MRYATVTVLACLLLLLAASAVMADDAPVGDASQCEPVTSYGAASGVLEYVKCIDAARDAAIAALRAGTHPDGPRNAEGELVPVDVPDVKKSRLNDYQQWEFEPPPAHAPNSTPRQTRYVFEGTGRRIYTVYEGRILERRGRMPERPELFKYYDMPKRLRNRVSFVGGGNYAGSNIRKWECGRYSNGDVLCTLPSTRNRPLRYAECVYLRELNRSTGLWSESRVCDGTTSSRNAS